jgi:hypothetical protein
VFQRFAMAISADAFAWLAAEVRILKKQLQQMRTLLAKPPRRMLLLDELLIHEGNGTTGNVITSRTVCAVDTYCLGANPCSGLRADALSFIPENSAVGGNLNVTPDVAGVPIAHPVAPDPYIDAAHKLIVPVLDLVSTDEVRQVLLDQAATLDASVLPNRSAPPSLSSVALRPPGQSMALIAKPSDYDATAKGDGHAGTDQAGEDDEFLLAYGNYLYERDCGEEDDEDDEEYIAYCRGSALCDDEEDMEEGRLRQPPSALVLELAAGRVILGASAAADLTDELPGAPLAPPWVSVAMSGGSSDVSDADALQSRFWFLLPEEWVVLRTVSHYHKQLAEQVVDNLSD